MDFVKCPLMTQSGHETLGGRLLDRGLVIASRRAKRDIEPVPPVKEVYDAMTEPFCRRRRVSISA